MNSEVKVKPSIPTLFDDLSGGKEASSDVEKADAFFTSVFTTENFDNIRVFPDRAFAASLDDITIDSDVVYNKLSNLQSDKAAGPDNLLPEC